MTDREAIVVRSAILFSSAILLSTTVFAATQTLGSITGTIRDANGTPLAGVKLLLKSSRSAPQSVLTDEEGVYWFRFLPPGRDYDLEIRIDGFERRTFESVEVQINRESKLDVNLRPEVAGEITVTATPPLIDVHNAYLPTTVTREQIESLPTRRDFQQLADLAPGVSFDKDPLNPSIGGASYLENDYIIEGMSTRDPRFGESATNLSMDFVEQVQVLTGVVSAEYGRTLGGVINVVTRSGTNRFQGSIIGYYEDQDWSSHREITLSRGEATTALGRDKKDWGFSVGGPLRRDRLWFFGAYNPRDTVTPRRFTDAGFGIDFKDSLVATEEVFAAKINAMPGSAHAMAISAFGNPVHQSGWMAGARSDPAAALISQYSGSKNRTLRYDGMVSSTFIGDVTLGHHDQHIYSRADTEAGRAAPAQFDTTRRFFKHGGNALDGDFRSERDLVAVRVSKWLGRHELKTGVEYEENLFDQDERQSFFYYFGPTNIDATIGRRDQLLEQISIREGYGSNDTTAVFLQDQWRADRFTVTAGLRWEQQIVSSGRGVRIATGVDEKGLITGRPADDFQLGNNWAPRFGMSFDPSATGRSKVYFSAGRFFQSLPVAINVSSLNGFGIDSHTYYSTVSYTQDNWYNPTGSPLNDSWIRYRSVTSEHIPIEIAPGTKASHHDEFAVGGEYQVGTKWVVSARYTDRRLRRAIAEHYFTETYVAGSERRGIHNGKEVISNVGEGEFGGLFEGPRRDYRAVELTAQRRLSNRWQLYASLLSSRERGEYEGFVNYSEAGGFPGNSGHYTFPRYQENASGKMHQDRPYVFKVHSSYELPHGVTVSEAFVYSAGTPISAFVGGDVFFQGRTVFLTKRGSMGRTPDYWNLDLHLAWAVPTWQKFGLTIVADIFNATDNDGVLEVDEDYIYRGMPGLNLWLAPENLDASGYPKFNPALPRSEFYGKPEVFQAPRAVQLGVRITI